MSAHDNSKLNRIFYRNFRQEFNRIKKKQNILKSEPCLSFITIQTHQPKLDQENALKHLKEIKTKVSSNNYKDT